MKYLFLLLVLGYGYSLSLSSVVRRGNLFQQLMFICGIPLHEQFFNLVLNVMWKFFSSFIIDSSPHYIKPKRIALTVSTVLEPIIAVWYVDQGVLLCPIGYPLHLERNHLYLLWVHFAIINLLELIIQRLQQLMDFELKIVSIQWLSPLLISNSMKCVPCLNTIPSQISWI